jgi:hypothetical protein
VIILSGHVFLWGCTKLIFGGYISGVEVFCGDNVTCTMNSGKIYEKYEVTNIEAGLLSLIKDGYPNIILELCQVKTLQKNT